jgi:UDP-N-acetylglucosamine transferase subunit ALG13
LIQVQSFRPFPSTPSIIILTGTGERGYERLLRGVDELIEEGKLQSPVLAQIGHSSYIPRHYAYERFLPHSELIAAIEASDLVITHEGAGSMREALSLGKPTIVVPRKSSKGELLWRSEFELARQLETLGLVQIVDDPSDVPENLAQLALLKSQYAPQEGPDAGEVLSEFLEALAKQSRGT